MSPLSRRFQSSIIAITRDLPETFEDALSEYSTASSISLTKAHAQHDEYVRVLENYTDQVIRLPALNEFPDSVFVEDTMVAVGSDVVLTNPGHPSRMGEVAHMQDELEKISGIKIVDDMRNTSNQIAATCDGGDVLQMGDLMFVGMSHRTNEAGYEVLKEAFPSMAVFKVPAVVQGSTVLHLKSATTNLNERAILVPKGTMGDKIAEAIQGNGRLLDVYRMDDALWCNVLSIQNTVIAQTTMDDQSKSVLEQACLAHQLDLDFVDTSELAAKDAALTCCSVFLKVDR